MFKTILHMETHNKIQSIVPNSQGKSPILQLPRLQPQTLHLTKNFASRQVHPPSVQVSKWVMEKTSAPIPLLIRIKKKPIHTFQWISYIVPPLPLNPRELQAATLQIPNTFIAAGCTFWKISNQNANRKQAPFLGKKTPLNTFWYAVYSS